MLPTLVSAVVLALQIPGAVTDTASVPNTGDPPLVAGAFRDSTARVLLQRAREARLRQDTEITSYDALAYQRLSMGVKISRMAPERILLRTETALRMRWQRELGALVEAKGARTVYPGAHRNGSTPDMTANIPDLAVLPYYPGQEPLWIENALVQVGVNDRDLVHPLTEGAEAHYTYRAGDSLTISLPDGTEIRLRELEVRPRTVGWNVIVGSLWFDVDRGNLARAIYRLTEPVDVFVHAEEDVPASVRMLASPRAEVTAIVVEYGLYEGRFWLRRLHSIEATVEAGSMSVHVSVANSYRYSAVNAPASSSPDSTFAAFHAALDAAGHARPDSLRREALIPCDTGTTHTFVRRYRYAPIPVHVTVPCDSRALADSPELPGSIYSSDEALFDGSRRELVAAALGLGAQPEWGTRPPALEYGLPLSRFNRIEGLSAGLRASQQLGAGYVADGTLRLGSADRQPNLELGLARTNLASTVRLGGYTRLVAANDWGSPLGFASSLSALLWGRDDGFYYRATGADVVGTSGSDAQFTWRLFTETQRTAHAENAFSFANLFGEAEFQPNIVAADGAWLGGSLRAVRALGLDPRGWRAFGDARLEAAAGETEYGRAAVDVTLSRALGPAASRVPLAALTLSAGSGLGDVPPQRQWFLGGTHTVRGQPPGTVSGDSYWFGRLELAQEILGVARLSVFGDAGWAGPPAELLERSTFRLDGREPEAHPVRGAGAGLGLVDGLLRMDVAKGIHPTTSWRTHLYLGARF